MKITIPAVTKEVQERYCKVSGDAIQAHYEVYADGVRYTCGGPLSLAAAMRYCEDVQLGGTVTWYSDTYRSFTSDRVWTDSCGNRLTPQEYDLLRAALAKKDRRSA